MKKIAKGYRLIFGYLGIFLAMTGVIMLLPLFLLVVPEYQSDVDYMIDRAIMKIPVALTRNLKCIKLILANNASQMISMGYSQKLHKLLAVYKEPLSWASLDLRFAFNYLQFIANTLKQNGETDEVIDFWIENTFVNRFIVK